MNAFFTAERAKRARRKVANAGSRVSEFVASKKFTSSYIATDAIVSGLAQFGTCVAAVSTGHYVLAILLASYILFDVYMHINAAVVIVK